jgi:hypothetical protein
MVEVLSRVPRACVAIARTAEEVRQESVNDHA